MIDFGVVFVFIPALNVMGHGSHIRWVNGSWVNSNDPLPALFSTTASSKRVSLGDSNNDRQHAIEIEDTYFNKTVTNSIEIPTPNLGFTTMYSSKKVSASGCVSDRQTK